MSYDEHLQLTFRHRAGVTPYTSSYEFAECCVFNKQSQPPGFFDLEKLPLYRVHPSRHTFSRSYGVILPSSFTRVLSNTIVFSTCPPVSVCGTVYGYLCLETFPGSVASGPSTYRYALPITPWFVASDLPKATTYMLRPGHPSPGSPSLLRPPIAIPASTGILTCFPSITLFSLTLGADSPCADDRCAGNLGLWADGLFTRLIVTHVSIRTSDTSKRLLNLSSTAYRTLLYRRQPPKRLSTHCFGQSFKPRYIFRADRLDQ